MPRNIPFFEETKFRPFLAFSPMIETTPIGPPRRRSRAANIKLDKLLKAGMARPRIEFLPGKARPIGQWSTEFIREVGIVCRMHASLSCHRWKEIKKTHGSKFYDAILTKFDVSFDDPNVVKIADKFMGQRLREYRCRLHTHYTQLGDVNKQQKPPKHVSLDEWAEICAWFETEKFQKLSKKNTASRKELKVMHCGGSKAFVTYQQEQRDAETQQELGRIELYHRTHFSSTKGWTSPIAQENYERILELKAEVPVEGSNKMTDDQICDEVLGKKANYTRGLGHGYIPESSYVSNNYVIEEYKKRAETAEKHNEELAAQLQTQGQLLQGFQIWQQKVEACVGQLGGVSMMSQFDTPNSVPMSQE